MPAVPHGFVPCASISEIDPACGGEGEYVNSRKEPAHEGAVLTGDVPDFRRAGDFLAERGLSGGVR
jgi:hypothetical protein